MEIISYYQQNPEQLVAVFIIMYMAFLIDRVFVHPKRCEKHGTNLELSNRIIGCEECFVEVLRKDAEEDRKQADEDIRRKARVFAEELKKLGGL